MLKAEFYVIVNLYDLAYQKNGTSVNLDEADKFTTIEEARKELKEYDEDEDLAIYKIIVTKSIYIEKVED